MPSRSQVLIQYSSAKTPALLDYIDLYTDDTIEIIPIDDDLYEVNLRFRLAAEPRSGRSVTQLYRAAEIHEYIRRCGLTGAHANTVAALRVAAIRIDRIRPGFAEVFAEIESKVAPACFPHVKTVSESWLWGLANKIAARRILRGENRTAVENVTVHAVGPFLHEWRRCSAAVYDVLRKGERTFPTETTLIL